MLSVKIGTIWQISHPNKNMNKYYFNKYVGIHKSELMSLFYQKWQKMYFRIQADKSLLFLFHIVLVSKKKSINLPAGDGKVKLSRYAFQSDVFQIYNHSCFAFHNGCSRVRF